MDTYALTRLQAASGTWYWSVHLKRSGRLYSRSFYDPKHGGPAGSRKAAAAWRDEQLAAVKPLGKLEFCQQQRSNNTSGVAGVHFLTSKAQPLGFWQARLKLAGRPAQSKSVSVKKHGYERAYQMAVSARQDMLARAGDEPYLYAEVAKRLSKRGASRKDTKPPPG